MKHAPVRPVGYAVVATLAAIAIWLTPSLQKKQVFAMEPLVVSKPGLEPADFLLQPVMVQASNTELVDTLAISGVIQSSLYNALNESGVGVLPPSARHQLAWRLADIFEYKVDMSRDLRQGDKFHLLVERLQKPNGAIIVNKILGAKLALSELQKPIEAIHFDTPGSSTDQYYDASGMSLRAAFLRAPVAFRRISSIFGKRKHPIFGEWRNHTGTDYAAAEGTPVRAIGDGVVIFAGKRGGYGNMIDIRHRNGMVSRYGHMRNFAKGMKPGTHVAMGSTIGYVGMTGWATGPHLHFEIRVDGVAKNPRLALESRSGEPIPASERALFQKMRNQTLASLNDAHLASIAE
ncbi:MAG TPA: M23 family metallopeptidase [Gemmatimonadaceae bacterium]|nr:M23 family metallopeptidase [Gemmatimonadaceae bacterium]